MQADADKKSILEKLNELTSKEIIGYIKKYGEECTRIRSAAELHKIFSEKLLRKLEK